MLMGLPYMRQLDDSLKHLDLGTNFYPWILLALDVHIRQFSNR